MLKLDAARIGNAPIQLLLKLLNELAAHTRGQLSPVALVISHRTWPLDPLGVAVIWYRTTALPDA